MPENTPAQSRLPVLTQVLIGPPGRILLPLVALDGLLILNDRSLPGGGPFSLLLLGLLLTFILIIVWVPRFVVSLLRSDGRRGLLKHWLRWTTAPLIGIAVIGLVYFQVPFDTRFALSRASLEHFAQTVAAGAEPGDQWVGLYPLTSIRRIDGGGAEFLVSGTGFLDTYGFAWSPKGPLEDQFHTYYTHIDGPWYIWQNRW